MSKENPTIMVVEDEVLLLQAITKKLQISGMEVLSCSSGQQAIDYLNSVGELPDAVWLDYYLKDMNGLTFMQEIKKNPDWAHLPVLVVSNSASPEKVHNMLGLGVKKYILKANFRLDEIIAIIRDFIANDGDETSTSTVPITPSVSSIPVLTPETPEIVSAPALEPESVPETTPNVAVESEPTPTPTPALEAETAPEPSSESPQN